MPKKKSPDLGLGPPLKFYNDTVTLRFSERDHIYYLEEDGIFTPVDGVTNTCHIIDKSFQLMPWACKMMAEKLLRTMPIYHDDICGKYTANMEMDEFVRIVNEAKSAHREKLEDAGDVGSAAHLWLEDTIQDAIENNGGIVKEMHFKVPDDPRAKSCGEAAFDWMQAHNVMWLATETKVYSIEYRYAGTLDGLAYVDGNLCIVDWKTSNYLKQDYLYQSAAYQYAREEEFPEGPIVARHILRLGKDDGKFEPWYATNFAEDFAAFLACLNLKRIHEKIENRIRETKKLNKIKEKVGI